MKTYKKTANKENENKDNPIFQEKNNRRFHLELKHIKFLVIGFEPLCSKVIHKFTNSISTFRGILPTSIGSKKFVHACAFLSTEEIDFLKDKANYEFYRGILVEFGKYDEDREGDYDTEVYYIGKDGARFVRYHYLKFLQRIEKNNQFLGKPLNKYPFILCKIYNHHNLLTLFSQIFFSINKDIKSCPYLWMVDLLKDVNEDKYKQQWEKHNYNLLNFNCQTLVTKIVESLCAVPYRIDNIDDCKMHIPIPIYEALKQNMNLIKERNVLYLNYRRKFIIPLTPIPMWKEFGNFLLLFNKGGNYQDDEEKEFEMLNQYDGKYHEIEKDKVKIENFKNHLRKNNIEGDYTFYIFKNEYKPISLIQEPAF